MPVAEPSATIPSMLEAAAIYEKEIKRLQGELSLITTEIQKQESRKGELSAELSRLDQAIQAAKDSVADIEESGKKKSAALAESHAASQKAIEARELDSQKVIGKADSKMQELAILNNKVMSARNFLVGLAEDIHSTMKNIQGDINDISLRVEKEVQDFYALRDLKANVPEKK